MLFFLTFLGFAVSRRPRVAKYVQFAHPSPRIYDNAIGCDMCQSVVQYIHNLLSDKTVESEIVKLLESFCSTFSSPYDTLCRGLTESYLPTLIEWIDQGIASNEICTKFGFCTAETKQKKVVRKFPGRIALPKDKRYVKGVGCDLCKSLVQYVEKLLEDKTVDDQIAALVEQLCTTFPSPYDSLCKTTVEQYLPLIIQWIDQGLQSSDICLTIGLCQAKLRKVQRIPTRLVLPKNYQNGIGCDMCKKVVQYIEQLLNDQKTEEEIALLVEQLCTFFPSPYDSLCDSLCEQYVPTIMQFIEKGMEAIDICDSLGLCDNKVKKVNKKRVIRGKMALPSPRIYDNSIGCDMCKKVVQYIEQLLKDEKIEEEIAQLVDQLCVNFASPYDSICKGIVDLYVPQIIGYIEQGMETLDICNSIGLCDDNIVQKLKSQKAKIVAARKRNQHKERTYMANSEEACETCKKWVKWTTDKLTDVTVEGLWKLINEECPKVPYLKYFCEIINEQNIQKFVDLIVAQVPPEVACGWTHLC